MRVRVRVRVMSTLTISSRRSLSAATTACTRSMRPASGIWGHSPCPRSHAIAAASTALMASSSPICASVPMTVRLPVSASWMGEDTSVEGPCHACTPPSSKIRLPLTFGFVSGPTVIDLARGRQSSSRGATRTGIFMQNLPAG